jgi:predicted PurR-regulated permease PerM
VADKRPVYDQTDHSRAVPTSPGYAPGAPRQASDAPPGRDHAGDARNHDEQITDLPVDTSDVEDEHPFGTPGRPLRRSSPFYIGFVGGLGALVAWYLSKAIVGASQVIVLIMVSMFLAVGLNPIVERLNRRGVPRRLAVLAVTLGVMLVFVGFLAAVVPPLASQTSDLITSIPDGLESLNNNPTIQRLDAQYGIIANISKFVSSPDLATTVFGGVLGVGKFVLGSLFSAFTVLILTLYFLSSLPNIKRQAYQIAPRSRRQRVQLLGDEILARIGGYVDGALTIATIAGISTFLLLEILSLKYAVTLALVVAILDLIPMVGASVGAAIVCLVALFDSPVKALVCVGFYVVYQQLENYLIYPRVMKRSVDVPPAMTVIAALIGGTMLGVVGALIAIPTAAAALLIFREVLVPRQEKV